MTTPLTKPLKRELQIQGRPFVVTLSPEGIKLVLKGKRKGQELRWEDLVSGEAALAVALNASLKAIPESGAEAQARASAPGHTSPEEANKGAASDEGTGLPQRAEANGHAASRQTRGSRRKPGPRARADTLSNSRPAGATSTRLSSSRAAKAKPKRTR
jgi:hypothetical protein